MQSSDQLLADPQPAAEVAAAHADADEVDGVYAMNLATIRKMAQTTQAEVARKLGVGQRVVSWSEHRDDMLLSTLCRYLMATGAEDASIIGDRLRPPDRARPERALQPAEQQSA